MPPWRSRSSTKPSRTLAALDVRDFRLLYIALFGTSVSYQLQRTIELWLVYDLTGSPLLTGFTGLVRGLATLVFQLAGGVVADRIDRRRFVILVQGVNALITLSLTTLALTGLIQVWHIYLAAFVNATLTTAAGPARTAMVPGLVPRELLVNAFAQIASVRKLSQLVGPAVGGVLIGFAGSGWTYAVACLIYIVSIPIMVCMRYESGPLDREQSPVKSLLEGIDFIRRNSLIVGLLVTEFAAVFFGSYRALLPIFAVAMGLGPEGLGILLAAPALGSLPGVAAVMWLGNMSYKGLFISFSVIAYAGCLFGLAFSTWFLGSVAILFLVGVFDALQAVVRQVVIQARTPDNLRGRAASFQRILGVGAPSLGEAHSGAVAALIGAPWTLVVTAAVCIGITAGLVVRRPDLRDRDL